MDLYEKLSQAIKSEDESKDWSPFKLAMGNDIIRKIGLWNELKLMFKSDQDVSKELGKVKLTRLGYEIEVDVRARGLRYKHPHNCDTSLEAVCSGRYISKGEVTFPMLTDKWFPIKISMNDRGDCTCSFPYQGSELFTHNLLEKEGIASRVEDIRSIPVHLLTLMSCTPTTSYHVSSAIVDNIASKLSKKEEIAKIEGKYPQAEEMFRSYLKETLAKNPFTIIKPQTYLFQCPQQ